MAMHSYSACSSNQQKDKETFTWSDDECQLLLSVTHEYKVKNLASGNDWEKVKNKYVDILKLYCQEMPEEPAEMGKDFPHKPEEITLKRLNDKLKAIRNKYRQAIDAKKRSGFGRVVMLFFELCEKIWGGSPATIQISTGIESSDRPAENADASGEQEDDNQQEGLGTSQTDLSTNGAPSREDQPSAGVIEQRRALLNDQLSNYRTQKMKRKLPADAQLVDCAHEDLQIKRKMITQMEDMDKRHSENMAKLTGNVQQLTASLTEGFSLLKNLMMSPQEAPPRHFIPYPSMHPYSGSQPFYPHTPVPDTINQTSSLNFPPYPPQGGNDTSDDRANK
jgi:hypothetical protein